MLSKEAETLILDSIQDVCGYVNDGHKPTEAVTKVAQERHLTPNFITLVCSGYNTGATTYQREKSSGILEKLADFPLADSDDVIAKLYPGQPRSSADEHASCCVSDEYSRPPSPIKLSYAKPVVKTAEAKEANCSKSKGTGKPMQAFNRMAYSKRKSQNKRAEVTAAKDKLSHDLAALRNFFSKSSSNITSVEFAAKQIWDNSVVNAVMDFAAPKRQKLSGLPLAEPANWEVGAYRLIKVAIESALDCHKKTAEYEQMLEDNNKEAQELLTPFLPEHELPAANSVLDTAEERQKTAAGFATGMLGALAGQYFTGPGSMMTQAPYAKTPAQMSSGMVDDLDDPDHDSELRRIRARTMLHDLMMNDEVISGYDPGEVMNAYNEIVSVTPRSAGQAAIIRPILRKRLTQGAIEPFEAAEMVNIEKNLGQSPHGATFGSTQTNKEGSANVLRSNILD